MGTPLHSIPPATMQVSMAQVGHLSKYGYMDEEKFKTDPNESERAIKLFQKNHGIEETGKCDDATSFAMKLPRCCHKDVTKRKPKNLNLEDITWPSHPLDLSEGDKWEKKKLTWRVTKFSSQEMPAELVNESLRRAFYIWEKHADITFHWVEEGVPDLEIRWEVGDHGDGDPFDGSGGTLAHAFFPQGDRLSGDLHFDDQEIWTLGTGAVGVNLTQAAAHEIGHSLGLDHSSDSSALMAPIYRGYKEEFDLMKDDIEKIQALYGKSTTAPQPVPAEKEWIPTKAPPKGSNGSGGSGGPSGSGGSFCPGACPCSVM